MNTEEQYWELDEPEYGKGPYDPFPGKYTVDGVTYDVTVQGFMEDVSGVDAYKYRAKYEDKTEKIIDYVIGIGFVEGWDTQTEHSIAIGKLIQKHFG